VKAHPFLGAEKAAGHGIARACRLLKVSRAACYQRRNGAPSARRAAGAAITARITSIHTESKGTYGSPRVHQVLRREDAGCGKRRAARLMRAAGLEGRRKKRWRTTTIAGPAAERARDLIQRDFAPRPGTDQRYAGDITYVMTWEGWAYLATVIDLSSRRVAGWALSDHMRTELVEDALAMAFAQRRPDAGVIFRSDRGCQCTSKDYAALARANGVILSVSRRANAGTTRSRKASSPPSSGSSSTTGPGPPGPGRAAPGRLRLHRGLVQHPAAPFRPRLSQPRRIRVNPPQRRPPGGMINSRNLSAKADQAQPGTAKLRDRLPLS
jgi:transposase InsO family protein